ncbi:MAG: alpha/beta fold hydrolase [Actinomycetota bacterium]|nr:alpha/beta fold hydrolase [Actinomycetota bacterium]
MRRWRAAPGAVLLALPLLALSACSSAPASEQVQVDGGPASATDAAPVTLDATIYVPDMVPAPAVVLAHGFGGSKADLDDRATRLSESGYVVVAYSARGFGMSTGQISMNAPDFEIADASAIVDYLATRDDVTLDGPGDPRVGFAGGSYGGALALMAAGYDPRVDAIAADITWNDLESSLFGQSAPDAPAAAGVFKALWTGNFFGVGVVNRDGTVTACGRFSAQWCTAYTDAAAFGTISAASRELMAASSPSSISSRIAVPTLISAGQSDSLFPIGQANATAEQIMAAHPQAPVKVVWHGGGHDGGIDESERLDDLVTGWFDTHLAGTADMSTAFEVTDTTGTMSVQNSGTAPVVLQADGYPGVDGQRVMEIPLAGGVQRVLAPAGGLPSQVTSVPGLGSTGGLVEFPVPGQSAIFQSAPLTEPMTIIGSSSVTLTVASVDGAQPEETALFASLRIVSPSGRATLPAGLVAPISLRGLDGEPRQVSVTLPAIVTTAGVGDSLRLVVSTTDFAYRLPQQPTLYDIGLAAPGVTVPLVDTEPVSTGVAPIWWIVGAAVIVALIVAVVIRLRPRHDRVAVRPDGDAPLAITGLTKRYGDDYLAVDDLTFTVQPGMVLGLLGPNGAGKTTTMRMAMGLIMPTAGHVAAFGQPVYAGAPVLARIGALVEGPGFLPHLTGRQNLDLFWRAAGRGDADPFLDEVLDIADLGSAVEKKVRTYSQGMRQRLGIAQAMLGKPDLLLLDEPTNGLDPPQIKAMRDVLHRYADSGRTVIISSHLLGEVEQTCTDVVVMHRGRLVGAGRVADLLSGTAGRRLEDVFLEIVGDDLTVGLP